MKLFDVEKLSYYAPTKGYSIKLKEINGNQEIDEIYYKIKAILSNIID